MEFQFHDASCYSTSVQQNNRVKCVSQVVGWNHKRKKKSPKNWNVHACLLSVLVLDQEPPEEESGEKPRPWMALPFDQRKCLNVPFATGMFPKSSISQCNFKQLKKNEASRQRWKTEWYSLIGICSFPSSVSGSPPPPSSSVRLTQSVSIQSPRLFL